jgi:hypothetical protein
VSLHFVRSRPTSLRDFVGVDFVRSLDLSPAPASPLANLSGGSVVVVLRSADLSAFPSSSSSCQRTSLQLCCRLRQVARPSSNSVTIFLSFLFWIIIPDILPATMLGY